MPAGSQWPHSTVTSRRLTMKSPLTKSGIFSLSVIGSRFPELHHEVHQLILEFLGLEMRRVLQHRGADRAHEGARQYEGARRSHDAVAGIVAAAGALDQHLLDHAGALLVRRKLPALQHRHHDDATR